MVWRMPESPIARLRLIGLLEGTSFLLLLLVAMPLKYAFGIPMAVKLVGWAHGVLFIAFVFALPGAVMHARWSMGRGALLFLSALLPCGPFFMDRKLREADGAAK